jgi:3-deoxy-D-manno-octulosonate 8-phosphate phosphatase (KDO 8-P phosphatase)
MHERCLPIELLLLDVDGVLTDGSIVYGDQGVESKAFFVRDGSGLKLWTGLGKQAGIISGRRSAVVERRAAELGISIVVQGSADKLAALEMILTEQQLAPEQVCYVGDDLPDVPVMARCGLAVAVADACRETQSVAHYVTTAPGGRGAVREVIEVILRAQGLWAMVLDQFGLG